MAGILEDAGILDVLRTIDEVLSVVGLSNPLYQPVQEADFDPDPSASKAEALAASLSELGAKAPPLEPNCWTGPARGGQDKNEDCLITLQEFLLDMAILLVEVIIELIDRLVDLVRFILVLVAGAATIVMVIVAVAMAISVITAGTSIPAAATAVGSTLIGTVSAYMTIAGAIAVVGGLILYFVNDFIEGVQEDLFEARNAGCLKATPLDSWDPNMPVIPS